MLRVDYFQIFYCHLGKKLNNAQFSNSSTFPFPAELIGITLVLVVEASHIHGESIYKLDHL